MPESFQHCSLGLPELPVRHNNSKQSGVAGEVPFGIELQYHRSFGIAGGERLPESLNHHRSFKAAGTSHLGSPDIITYQVPWYRLGLLEQRFYNR